jgi:hypothetical protein
MTRKDQQDIDRKLKVLKYADTIKISQKHVATLGYLERPFIKRNTLNRLPTHQRKRSLKTFKRYEKGSVASLK